MPTRALNLLFPPQCLSCDEIVPTHGTLCNVCWGQIHFISEPFCHCCGVPFDYAVEGKALCGECARALPNFTHARSVMRYDGWSKHLVLMLKYQDKTFVAPAYGRWLAKTGAEMLAHCDLIIPVPLHYWRFVGRRYNQAALLAYALGKESHLEVIPDALIRKRPTRAQTGLTLRQRKANVRNAFYINPKHVGVIKSKTIMLIDDVMTTSATAQECAKVLLKAGAIRVNVLTLARTVKVD